MRFTNIHPPRAARWLVFSLLSLLLCSHMQRQARAQAVATTTVQGTVYDASGQPASGSVTISWPAFTTNAGQAVAAGRMNVNIGADGFLSVNLAPNAGAQPAGLYYTAVYHLNGGATSTEYWTVPATPQATIAQIRAQVLPAAQAVQAVSKSYVDSAIQSLTSGTLASNGGALTGPLYLNGDPAAPTQAADKHYVDAQFAQALPLSGGAATGPLTATRLGAVYQVDQFPGSDFGAKLQACVNSLSSATGGVCDARNFPSAVTIANNVTIATANAAIELPCSTITTAAQLIVTAGTRNVAIHGCSFQGGSSANGTAGGTVWVYTGSSNAFQVGDTTGAVNTPGFWMRDINLNTANAGASATGIYFERAQELRLDGIYLNGNGSTGQTGIVLDGTGNYAGGTFIDVYINAFGTGWKLTGDTAGNYANASTFIKTHVVCPTATSGSSPLAGTIGINLLEGDGNTFSGGDVESCDTMFHLGPEAINNTVVGLRNENSNTQYIADSGSSFNSVITGGTLYTGKLVDNGSRNSFSDAFHRATNGMKGDWYASQQDATVTNHLRLGTGTGNERGMLNEVQTDYGNRWEEGYSDAMGTGYQIWQLADMVNNVNRFAVGQYLSAAANVVTNVVLNNGGCYTSNTPPTVTFSGGGGTGAAGTAVMYQSTNPNCNGGNGWGVASVTMTSNGSGYTSAPTVTFAGSNQVTAPNPTAEIVTAGGTNNQTVINAAGSGAIVLNGSSNAGTGGVVIGSGGANETTVATISNTGNAQFTGALQVGGTAQTAGTLSVKNNADAEVDYYLQPGATTSQKGSFVYKDFNGASQWYMVKDQNNNWALNSATGGLDSFKAYQSTNSGDTYVNASNTTGHIRLNYESGSGAETDIYSNGALDATFSGPTSIKFPGIAAGSGSHYCLQVDSSGYITNTGGACVSANGTSGQIASYSSSGAVIGISAVSVSNGGTGATTASAALANLGAQAAMSGVASDGANGLLVAGNVTAAAAVANQIAKEYYASGYSASGSNTAADNFWAALLANTPASSSFGQASGVLSPGTSTTANGFSLTAPSTNGNPTLSLMLRGAGSGFYGLDTMVKASGTLANPLLYFPPLSSSNSTPSAYWLNPHLSGFTLNPNFQAQSCLAANRWLNGTANDISCIGSATTGSWISFGTESTASGGNCPAGDNCGNVNTFADNVLAWSGSNMGPADVAVTVSSGAVTGLSVSGYDSSKHYVYGGTLPVLFKCSTPGRTCFSASPAATATMVSDGAGLYTVGSFTITSGGTSVTSGVIAVIPDMPAAANGVEIYAADSTFKDTQVSSVGQNAGITTTGSLSTLLIHPHAWNLPVAFNDFSQGLDYLYPEIDTVYNQGFHFSSGGTGMGTVVDTPTFIYPADSGSGLLNNVIDYKFDGGVSNVTIMNQKCQSLNPNSGYTQFVKLGGIPFDVGYGWQTPSTQAANLYNSQALPVGLTVFNSHPCSADPTPASGVFVESRGLDSTDPNRVMTFTAGNTNAAAISTPFLIAELPPSSLSSFTRSSARFTLSGGVYNSRRGRLTVTLSNGSSFAYDATATGADASQFSNAYLQAYQQSNGFINVYLYLAASSVATVRVDNVLDNQTHLEPHPAQAAPTGTLVYDSSQPATYNDSVEWAQKLQSRNGQNLYLGTSGGPGNGTSVYFEVNGSAVEQMSFNGADYLHNPAADNTGYLGQTGSAYKGIAGHAIWDEGIANAAAVYTDASGQLHSAGENPVSFSATPVFSATSSVNTLTLTGNVTSSTLPAGTPGFHTTMIVCQDTSGGHTFAWPSNVRGGMAIGATASTCSTQEFVYSGVLSAWIAASSGVANE